MRPSESKSLRQITGSYYQNYFFPMPIPKIAPPSSQEHVRLPHKLMGLSSVSLCCNHRLETSENWGGTSRKSLSSGLESRSIKPKLKPIEAIATRFLAVDDDPCSQFFTNRLDEVCARILWQYHEAPHRHFQEGADAFAMNK